MFFSELFERSSLTAFKRPWICVLKAYFVLHIVRSTCENFSFRISHTLADHDISNTLTRPEGPLNCLKHVAKNWSTTDYFRLNNKTSRNVRTPRKTKWPRKRILTNIELKVYTILTVYWSEYMPQICRQWKLVTFECIIQIPNKRHTGQTSHKWHI